VYGELQQERDIQGGNLNKKVYVANLPSLVGGPELKALFSKSGSVMSAKIVKDRQTDQPRGTAFVEMSTQWEARRAVSMLSRIDPAYVHDLYQKVGLDFADKVIDPAFNDFVKEVVPTYPIGKILPKREEIRQMAMKKLGDNLSRYHIIVDDIYFANIRFSPEYEGAIEAKQVAQQQVETQKQVLAQREIEAQQKIATAKGEAESILVVAQGQAKANDALSVDQPDSGSV